MHPVRTAMYGWILTAPPSAEASGQVGDAVPRARFAHKVASPPLGGSLTESQLGSDATCSHVVCKLCQLWRPSGTHSLMWEVFDLARANLGSIANRNRPVRRNGVIH